MTKGEEVQEVKEVRIYADACSPCFALKWRGEAWVREFSSLREAIRYAIDLPREGTMTILLHDENGLLLTRLDLRPC